jgi:hypothetical protein
MTLEAPFFGASFVYSSQYMAIALLFSVLFKWCNHIALMRWFAWE